MPEFIENLNQLISILEAEVDGHTINRDQALVLAQTLLRSEPPISRTLHRIIDRFDGTMNGDSLEQAST